MQDISSHGNLFSRAKQILQQLWSVWNTLVYQQQQDGIYETKPVTRNQICPVYEIWEENKSKNKQIIKLQITESHLLELC
jgi:predicted choloylglycine hydrolase